MQSNPLKPCHLDRINKNIEFAWRAPRTLSPDFSSQHRIFQGLFRFFYMILSYMTSFQ